MPTRFVPGIDTSSRFLPPICPLSVGLSFVVPRYPPLLSAYVFRRSSLGRLISFVRLCWRNYYLISMTFLPVPPLSDHMSFLIKRGRPPLPFFLRLARTAPMSTN